MKLVKNLVREYIKADNVLVLLACSMEGDVANSAASRIVRDMDATSRCVGKVLFKRFKFPDNWLDERLTST